MQYRAVYECNDGTILGFNFESNRRIVRNSQINLMTNPLLNEVYDRLSERKANPNNKMHEHGGYKKLLKIKNRSTGTVQYYDLW